MGGASGDRRINRFVLRRRICQDAGQVCGSAPAVRGPLWTPTSCPCARAQRHRAPQKRTIAADESAVLGDIEAKKKRIRARQPPGKQGRHQRIFQPPAIALRPGAVDDPIDFQRARLATLAFAVGDLDPVVVLYIINDSAGVHSNLSRWKFAPQLIGQSGERRGADALPSKAAHDAESGVFPSSGSDCQIRATSGRRLSNTLCHSMPCCSAWRTCFRTRLSNPARIFGEDSFQKGGHGVCCSVRLG